MCTSMIFWFLYNKYHNTIDEAEDIDEAEATNDWFVFAGGTNGYVCYYRLSS